MTKEADLRIDDRLAKSAIRSCARLAVIAARKRGEPFDFAVRLLQGNMGDVASYEECFKQIASIWS